MTLPLRLIAPLRTFDHRHWHRWPRLCTLLARIEWAAEDGACDAPGCAHEDVLFCYYPDHADPHPPDAVLCYEHIEHSGFCRGCGRFWAGVESFEFSRSKLCDDCQHEADMDDGLYDDLDEMVIPEDDYERSGLLS